MAAKRVLIVSDGSQFSESALEFALAVYKGSDVQLAGIFVQDLSYLSMLTLMGSDELMNTFNFRFVEESLKAGESKVKGYIDEFRQRCKEANVHFEVLFEKGSAPAEIIHESTFCDLIIIGYQSFFANIGGRQDDHLLRDVLSEAQCPVVVVPEAWKVPGSVVFGFDGKYESTYALRQFLYLMPAGVLQVPFRSVSVDEDGTLPEDHQMQQLQSLMNAHGINMTSIVKKGKAGEEIRKEVESQTSPILVMGSYGRSLFSMLFHHSASDSILRSQQVPVFITHR